MDSQPEGWRRGPYYRLSRTDNITAGDGKGPYFVRACCERLDQVSALRASLHRERVRGPLAHAVPVGQGGPHAVGRAECHLAKGIGEPDEGEPHVRFEVARAGDGRCYGCGVVHHRETGLEQMRLRLRLAPR